MVDKATNTDDNKKILNWKDIQSKHRFLVLERWNISFKWNEFTEELEKINCTM